MKHPFSGRKFLFSSVAGLFGIKSLLAKDQSKLDVVVKNPKKILFDSDE